MSRPGTSAPGATHDDRLWAGLAYFTAPFGPLLIRTLPEQFTRPFVRTHTIQALALGALVAACAALLYLPTLGLSIALFTVNWFYAYRAYQGEQFAIPGLSDLLARRGWL
jgi:uncharacterized membrane protein